jgi:hypothetical protein
MRKEVCMASRTVSLARHVSWHQVLTLLGVEIPTFALPACLRCPCCPAGMIHVYHDAALGGQWLHCPTCRFAGDVIELAARVWGLDVPVALLKLQELSPGLFGEPLTPDTISNYVRDHVEYRRAVHSFWTAAQKRLPRREEPGLRLLLKKFGIERHAGAKDWPVRGGQFLGASTRKAVEEFFQPGAYATQLRKNRDGRQSVRRGSGAGPQRIFTGIGWGEVLVVPFYDLPARICGFLFVGREAKPERGDFVYKAVPLGHSQYPHEAGLAMLENVFAPPHRHLGETLFVIPDPVTALHLQARHLVSWGVPLPLVMTYQDDRHLTTARVWDQLPQRPRVYWAPVLDHRVINQARQAGAEISSVEVSRHEQHRWMDHRPAQYWLRYFNQHRVTWGDALEKALRARGRQEVEELLIKLQFRPNELQDFLRGCQPDLAQRVEEILDQRVFHRRVAINGKTVVDTGSAWVLEPGGELICNAAVRIERILRTSSGLTLYDGYVRIRDETIPFRENVRRIDQHGLLTCLRDRLLDAGKGPLIYQRAWDRCAVELAMQLHPPEVIPSADRVGWNEFENRFDFPHYSICADGQVHIGSGTVVAEGPLPAQRWVPPRSLTPMELEQLSRTSAEVRLFWALTACVAHNLLAAALHQDPVGIVLEGDGARAAGTAIARLLGSIELAHPAGPVRTISTYLDTACGLHGIPMIVSGPDGPKGRAMAAWLAGPGERNCIVPADWHLARILGMHGWHVVRLDTPIVSVPGVSDVAAAVLPRYLEDLGRRRLQLVRHGAEQVRRVLHDMADWMGREGGRPRVVHQAQGLITPAGDRATVGHFGDLVGRLVHEGALKVADGRKSGTKWVPMLGLNQVLAARQVPEIDAGLITRALQAADVLVAEQKVQGEPGWLISSEWWRQQYERCSVRRGGRSRSAA